MKRFTQSTAAMLVALLCSVALSGCQQLKNVAALANIKNLQFKLGDVNGFLLNGVDISNQTKIGPLEVAKVGAAVARGTLPVEFTLNVLAKNPNTGSGSTQPTPLYLNKMEWTMIINDRTTISGVVNRELEIPASGQTTTIPLQMRLDLFKFFNDESAADLIDLALAIGGANGSSTNLKLLAKVAVRVPGFGTVNYPGELTIVNHTFTAAQ